MADVVTTINGVPVTITDDGDSTYSIDLSTQQARQFIREELDQVRSAKADLVDQRDRQELSRLKFIELRDVAAATKDALNVEIGTLNTRINELVAFLQAQGDQT